MPKRKIIRLRWYINAMLFLACAICYLDRNILAVVAPTMMKELGITEVEYGYVNSVFYFTYAIIYTLGGWFMDKIGTRRGFSIIMLLWTAASMAHAAVRNVFHLMVARFFLAIGEGGNYPGCTKVTSEWFPPNERSVAAGYFNAGSMIGAALAPPIVAFITHFWGWQAAFLSTGSLGILWVIAWRSIGYKPEHHGQIHREELLYIKGVRKSTKFPDDDAIILDEKRNFTHQQLTVLESETKRNKKSPGFAYFALAVFGFLGLHRFYLKSWRMGLFYIANTILFLIGLAYAESTLVWIGGIVYSGAILFDLFSLYHSVDLYNRDIELNKISRITGRKIEWEESAQSGREYKFKIKDEGPKAPAIFLFRYTETWALFVARFLLDQAWYFYAAWTAIILQRVYNYSLIEVGAVLWIPFACADLGSIAGGWTSRILIDRGWEPLRARKSTMLFYSALVPLSIIGGFTDGHSWIFVASASLACFSMIAWGANSHTLSMDCFPSKYVGTVSGFGGTGSSIGGGISQALIGIAVVSMGYMPVIVIYGFFPLLATLSVYLLAHQHHDVDADYKGKSKAARRGRRVSGAKNNWLSSFKTYFRGERPENE